MKTHLWFLLIPLIFAGCILDEGEAISGNIFGAQYFIDDTKGLPKIENDSLIIKVVYGACLHNHTFIIIRNHISDTLNQIWLYKTTPDQYCAVVAEEVRSFKLPDTIKHIKRVQLIGPLNYNLYLK